MAEWLIERGIGEVRAAFIEEGAIVEARIKLAGVTPAGTVLNARLVDAGKLRALATTGAKRASTMPSVPTVAESGYPGFEATNWYAFVAPGKTPKDLLDFWNRALTKVLNDPQVGAELAKHGLDPEPGTRDELAQYIERERLKWGKVVREAKITAE